MFIHTTTYNDLSRVPGLAPRGESLAQWRGFAELFQSFLSFFKFNGCKGKPFFLTDKQNISFFLIKLLIVSNHSFRKTDYHNPIRFRHRDLSCGKPRRAGSEENHPHGHRREVPTDSKLSRRRFSVRPLQLIAGKPAAIRRILLPLSAEENK